MYIPKVGDFVISRWQYVKGRSDLWAVYVQKVMYVDLSSDTVRLQDVGSTGLVTTTNVISIQDNFLKLRTAGIGFELDGANPEPAYSMGRLPEPVPDVAEPPSLWEILVPTVRPKVYPFHQEERYFKKRYHKVWDQKVREIAGGLTIMGPVKGQWISPDSELFIERMIPVRIMATKEQIEKVIDLTLNYYDQQAVLCYKVSSEVILKHRETK